VAEKEERIYFHTAKVTLGYWLLAIGQQELQRSFQD
jgi:hypothetical protein